MLPSDIIIVTCIQMPRTLIIVVMHNLLKLVLGNNMILSYIAIFYLWYCLQIAISSYRISRFLCIWCNLHLCNSLMEAVVKLNPKSASYAFPNALSLLDHSGMDIVISWLFRWWYIVGKKLWYHPALLKATIVFNISVLLNCVLQCLNSISTLFPHFLFLCS